MQVIDQMHHGRGELGGLLSPSLYVSGVSSSECAIGLDSVSEPDSPDRFPGGQRTGSAQPPELLGYVAPWNGDWQALGKPHAVEINVYGVDQ